MIRRLLLQGLLGLFAATLAAQTFHRQVLPAGPGPQRLDVDLALLGATRAGLADLRLKDGQGRDVPYVLVGPDPGQTQGAPARILPLAATRTTSGVELDLGAQVQGSRLRLEGLRAPFLKRFTLEGSGDRQRWTELVHAGSLFDLPEEGFRLLEATFPEGTYRYLRLVWDDRSSAPVPAPRAALLLKAATAPDFPVVALPFRRRPSEPGVSRFALGLPGPRLPIRALVLSVAGDGPLLREAQVTEPRLTASSIVGLAPRILGSARLRRAQRDGATAYALSIPLEGPEGSELELRVQDGDNPGLELTDLKVELERQPWIYFEAANAAPLTAQCGDPRATAPRYDLEALRDRLPHTPVARAAWGALVAPPAAGADASLDGGVGAVLGLAGFRYQRALPTGPQGLTALALDAHVLACSKGLQDLRLLDTSGRQLPYLLEARDEPLAQELSWPRGRTREHSTTYAVTLPQAGLPASRLVLETGVRVFRRRVRVLAGDPAEVVAVADWSHGAPETAAPALVLPLPPLATREVTVEVDEGDNQPLVIQSARLLLPSWRLRFFRTGEPTLLCYGRELTAPDYDLALLAGRLREAPAVEVALPGATVPAASDPGRRMLLLFWGALATAVLGLLLLLRKVLHEDPQDLVADEHAPHREP